MLLDEKDFIYELTQLLQYKTHYYCEDCWYSCPKTEEGCCDDRQGTDCNCGADTYNKKIDEFKTKYAIND